MVYKTPNSQLGITLLELLLAVAFSFVLLAALILAANPYEQKSRTRDVKRLSDMSLLDRIINEYRVDKGVYPDDANVLKLSTAGFNWILGDFAVYTSRLPIDPINDAAYHYSYKHTQTGYEINAKLEYLTSNSSSDGGNDSQTYELGNDLTIL